MPYFPKGYKFKVPSTTLKLQTYGWTYVPTTQSMVHPQYGSTSILMSMLRDYGGCVLTVKTRHYALPNKRWYFVEEKDADKFSWPVNAFDQIEHIQQKVIFDGLADIGRKKTGLDASNVCIHIEGSTFLDGFVICKKCGENIRKVGT